MIFETERLLVRKLIIDDLEDFHKMESNPNVLKFADGEVKTFAENKLELLSLIDKYDIVNNDFWIYAIVNKSNNKFIGTIAFVKDEKDDEIGYRFLEEYWGNGFGFEICEGMVCHAKKNGLKKLVAYAFDENFATLKILKKNNFKVVHHFISDEKVNETKFELDL